MVFVSKGNLLDFYILVFVTFEFKNFSKVISVLVYKNSNEVLNKLKTRQFRAFSLSAFDFSTFYTTLPHNLIKEKLNDLIEWTFHREDCLYLNVFFFFFSLLKCM